MIHGKQLFECQGTDTGVRQIVDRIVFVDVHPLLGFKWRQFHRYVIAGLFSRRVPWTGSPLPGPCGGLKRMLRKYPWENLCRS